MSVYLMSIKLIQLHWLFLFSHQDTTSNIFKIKLSK